MRNALTEVKRESKTVDVLLQIKEGIDKLNGELKTQEPGGRTRWNTKHKASIGTSAIFITRATGKLSFQNTGTTTVTLGSSDEIIAGQGLVLAPASSVGAGDGDLDELNTVGDIFGISSASGGRVTIIKE